MDVGRVNPSPDTVVNNQSGYEQKTNPTFFERIHQFGQRTNQKRIDLQDRVVTWIRTNITERIKRICRMFVFIFTPSAFDPKHPHFIEIINNKETIVEKLNTKLELLKLAEFSDKNNSYFNDLTNLRFLSHNIPESVCQLKEFLSELQLYKKPFEIQHKIEALLVSYQKIETDLNPLLKKNANMIFNTYNEIVKKLKLQSLANPPKDVLKELLDYAKEHILRI